MSEWLQNFDISIITSYVIPAVFVILWLYLLSVFKRAETWAFRFLFGTLGFFLIYMVYFSDYVAHYVSRAVTTVAGVFGVATGWFTAYYDSSLIFVYSKVGSVTLQIDIECSGAIEIGVFLSLLLFFRVYNWMEKLLYGALGVMYLITANAIRVLLISGAVYWFGYGVYDLMHAVVGRIVFYAFSVILYYYVFTRSQIQTMKVGDFGFTKKKGTAT